MKCLGLSHFRMPLPLEHNLHMWVVANTTPHHRNEELYRKGSHAGRPLEPVVDDLACRAPFMFIANEIKMPQASGPSLILHASLYVISRDFSLDAPTIYDILSVPDPPTRIRGRSHPFDPLI